MSMFYYQPTKIPNEYKDYPDGPKLYLCVMTSKVQHMVNIILKRSFQNAPGSVSVKEERMSQFIL